MNSKNQIIPKWGIKRYMLRGCKSFELIDPKMRISLPTSRKISSKKYGPILKQLKKVGKIQCFHCIHLKSGQCPFTRDMIQEKQLSYKKKKVKCYHCNSKILNFQEYLLRYKNEKYVCKDCETSNNLGILKERLKKLLKPNWVEIFHVFFMLLFMIGEITVTIVKTVKGEPNTLIIIFALIITPVLLYSVISSFKERKLKKRRLKELE